MEVRVGQRRRQLVVGQMPKREHVLVAQVLLEGPQHVLTYIPPVFSRLRDCLQELRVTEELARVEHLPPVRESVIRNATVQEVRHEAVRQLAARPIIFEVRIPARGPLSRGRVEGRRVRDGNEEAAAIRPSVAIAGRAVSLDRIGGDGARLARPLHGLQHILHRPARAARIVRPPRHCPLRGR